MTTILVFCAGLLVGWNALPQPAWAKILWEKGKEKLQTMLAKKA